jgi:hypothetical protein
MALPTTAVQLLIVFTISTAIASNVGQRTTLGNWRIRRDTITLSGFSSGGTFAQQMQFSYSSMFTGIAVFSHTYYRCGPGNGNADWYDDVCTLQGEGNYSTQVYNPKNAIADIKRYFDDGLIENPKNLRNTKLYVFTGLSNNFFTPEMSLNILKIYEPLIRNPLNIQTRVMDAELLLPSDSYGKGCTERETENGFLIGNCGLSGAWESLRFLLGPSIRKPGKVKLGPLQTFSQREFFVQEEHHMDDEGFVYVPQACRSTGKGRPRPACHLHFYFHGCQSSRGFVGAGHVLNSGFLEVAEANNIVVVFPQNMNGTRNIYGCWDTFGLTGKDYATRKGPQVQVVRNMLSRILGDEDSLIFSPSTANEAEGWSFS